MDSASRAPKRWTPREDQILREEADSQLAQGALKDWTEVATRLPGRTNRDCRKRWSKISVPVKRGNWDAEEDARLTEAVEGLGPKWTQVAELVGTRHADQCAKRWTQNLDPKIDHSEWKEDEDRRLLAAVASGGRSWSRIAEAQFPGRSELSLKNRYTSLKRKGYARENGYPSPLLTPLAPLIDSIGELEGEISLANQTSPFSGLSTRSVSQLSIASATSSGRRQIFDMDVNGGMLADISTPFLEMPHTDWSTFHGCETASPELLHRADYFMPTNNDFQEASPDSAAGPSRLPYTRASKSFNDLPHLGFPSHSGGWFPPPTSTHADLSILDAHDLNAMHPEMSMMAGLSSTNPGMGLPIPSSKTTLVVENIQEETLSEVLNVLLHSKTKVKFSTDHVNPDF